MREWSFRLGRDEVSKSPLEIECDTSYSKGNNVTECMDSTMPINKYRHNCA